MSSSEASDRRFRIRRKEPTMTLLDIPTGISTVEHALNEACSLI